MPHIGVLTLEIFIPDAQSLKAKRRVLKSMKDQIRTHHNVSVAEIDLMDKWQRATLGVCMIGSDKAYIDAALRKILDFLHTQDSFQISTHQIEFV